MDYRVDYGMKINESKTKFMALNVQDQAITLIASVSNGYSSFKISSTDSNIYLGSIFKGDGTISSFIKVHVESKKKGITEICDIHQQES